MTETNTKPSVGVLIKKIEQELDELGAAYSARAEAHERLSAIDIDILERRAALGAKLPEGRFLWRGREFVVDDEGFLCVMPARPSLEDFLSSEAADLAARAGVSE